MDPGVKARLAGFVRRGRALAVEGRARLRELRARSVGRLRAARSGAGPPEGGADRRRLVRRRRFPVAARLTTILVGVSLSTVLLAALVDDRALTRGLDRVAQQRFDLASRTAHRLVATHLSDTAVRFSAVSRTPELRAHLELGAGPTLARLADSLAERTGASDVVFLDAGRRIQAQHGAASRAAELVARWTASAATGSAGCVAAGNAATSEEALRASPYDQVLRACGLEAENPPLATLVHLEGRAHASAALPLLTGDRIVGWLVVAEPIQEELRRGWSELVGERVEIAAATTGEPDPDRVTALRLGDVAVRVSRSFAPERETLRTSRRNQALAGLLSILVALGLSALVARDFLRPIHRIQRVAKEVGGGNLEARIGSARRDEIGDVARVLDDTLDSLLSSQQRLRNVQRAARFADWSFDPDADLVDGSSEFESALGLPRDSSWSMGTVLRSFPPGDRARLDAALRRCLDVGTSIDLDLRREVGPDESRIFHLQAARSSADPSGRIEGSLQDVTERRHAEDQIRFLAFHDGLTGLPNRRFLNERLALAVTPGQPHGFSLFFLDLDRFKLVNDTLGHSAGDELLRQVARRLGRVLDAHSSATVARFGGDEFTLLFPGMTEVRQQEDVAQKLLRAIAEPFDLEGNRVVVTGSVGIATWPRDGESIEDVTRSCDTALHQAKERGRNDFCLFDHSMRAAANDRWKLESRLRQAIDADHLEIYYQPRVESAGSRLVGLEALLRWHDTDFGGYQPADFVPIAEETGLIVPLGSWVLRRVVQQIVDWQQLGLRVPVVSVNLSGRQLQDELVPEVQQILAESGVDPACLEFEVTETAVIADAEQGIAVLEKLRALGIRISLDDFGTGYSSLSYLRSLPISAVKIDGSFVRSIASDAQGLSLVSSIVSMAKVLGHFVVAEGVETEEQAELLSEIGCDELQGFLFGEAEPKEVVTRRLRARKPLRKPKRRRRRDGARS